MIDLARRYTAAQATREGRYKIATGFLMTAIAINLVATLLPLSWPQSKAVATFLLGVGGGMLIVSVIGFISNRRVS